MVQRTETQMPQVGQQGPAQLQVQDTFGVSRVAKDPNPDVASTLLKFGNKVAADEYNKEVQANFAAGQALRASGATLTGKEPLPSRKGFKALDAKLRAQEFLAGQKEMIDNQDNDLDPAEYSKQLGDRFKDLLSGDPETDKILTASMGQYAAELGRYHADANYKKRTSDGVNQATQDVRNHLLEIQSAKAKGDQVGEAGAREALASALTLPTVHNPQLRQQLAADLSIMGLELGDPSVINYAREAKVEFSPEQERAIASASAKYNTKMARDLDIKYQNDTADFEANVAGAKSVEEYRELAERYQKDWPNRATNKYMIAQEVSFRRNLAIGAKNKLFKEEMRQGNIGKIGATNKQIQATYESLRSDILEDGNLSPDQQDKAIRDIVKSNGVVINSLKTELTSGLAVPLKDGLLHPNFQEAFEKTLTYYQEMPDLTLRHLPEAQRQLFLDARAATTYGGMALGDAVSALEEHRVNRKALTRDEREDFSESITDAVGTVLGKGFFNIKHGLTTTLNNEAEVRTRLTALANIALNQGMQDPEAAVEFARTQILETHEQVGNSLVFNNGKPIAERMGVPANRVQDAMDFLYDAMEEQRPEFNRDDSVLLGDPEGNTLLVGSLNEYGVIDQVFPANLAAVGMNFKREVIRPEYIEAEQEEAAAVLHAEDTQDLIKQSQELLGWTEDQANAATSNIVGRTVTEQRVKAALEDKAEAELVQRYGIESEDELKDLKMMRAAFSPGNSLTTEQMDLLQDGKLEEYMATLGQKPGIPDEVSQDPK